MRKIVIISVIIVGLVFLSNGCRSIGKVNEEIISIYLTKVAQIAEKYDIPFEIDRDNDGFVCRFPDHCIFVYVTNYEKTISKEVVYQGDNCDFNDEFYNLFIEITRCFYDVDGNKVKEHIKTAIKSSEQENTYNYEKSLNLLSGLMFFFNKFSYSDYEISINKI